MLNLVALILLFPLIGTAINGLIGKRLRKETVGYVACGAIGLSFLSQYLYSLDFFSCRLMRACLRNNCLAGLSPVLSNLRLVCR